MSSAFKKANSQNAMQIADAVLNVTVQIQKCPEFEAKLDLSMPRTLPKRRHSVFGRSSPQSASKKRRATIATVD